MIVRLTFRTDVVLPLTEIPGDASCHVLPEPDGSEAKTGVPMNKRISGTEPLLDERLIGSHVYAPVNFVVSVPPMVSSAFPTALGVTYKLKSADMDKAHQHQYNFASIIVLTRQPLVDQSSEYALSSCTHAYFQTTMSKTLI